MIKIKRITFDEWKKVFLESKSSNYFQSPEWLELQSKIFNLKNVFYEFTISGLKRYISFQEKDNNIYSGFIGYGGILAKDREKINLKIINKLLEVICNNKKITLVRIKLYPLLTYIGNKSNFSLINTTILQIEKNFISQEKKINKKTRNLVKNAIKHGVNIKKILPKDVESFYKFYRTTMKRVNSEYLTPIELFQEFSKSDNVDFIGAYVKDCLVAGSVFLKCNHCIYYWWNSSSDQGRKVNANYLLIFEELKNAVMKNYLFLDMASSHTINIENPKIKWGAKKTPLYILSIQDITL